MRIIISDMTNRINAATIATSNNALVAKVYGATLTYSPETDARIVGAIDGKLQCRDEEAAYELAGEMRAAGIPGARDLGCAVVFWR